MVNVTTRWEREELACTSVGCVTLSCRPLLTRCKNSDAFSTVLRSKETGRIFHWLAGKITQESWQLEWEPQHFHFSALLLILLSVLRCTNRLFQVGQRWKFKPKAVKQSWNCCRSGLPALQVQRYYSSAIEATDISVSPHFGRKDTGLDIAGIPGLTEVDLCSLCWGANFLRYRIRQNPPKFLWASGNHISHLELNPESLEINPVSLFNEHNIRINRCNFYRPFISYYLFSFPVKGNTANMINPGAKT